MKIVRVGSDLPRDTEHLVIHLGDEPVMYHFQRQIDDILISSPDGDILLCWDLDHNSEWDDEKCMLLKAFDNQKEIGNIKTSLFAMKAREQGKNLTVYLTAQIN